MRKFSEDFTHFSSNDNGDIAYTTSEAVVEKVDFQELLDKGLGFARLEVKSSNSIDQFGIVLYGMEYDKRLILVPIKLNSGNANVPTISFNNK